MTFPRLCLVRQKFPDRRIPDVAAEVRRQLAESGFAARLKPGSRVAIGVGSRGIHNIATIVRSAVRLLERPGHAAVPLSRHGQPRRSLGGGPGRGAGALRHHRGNHGLPGGKPARRRFARQNRRRHRSLHGQTGLRFRRRDARGPRQMAHRFCRQDRERPVQDDGHRTRQVRRRAALPRLRLPAGAGTRHPQHRAPGAGVGKDSGRPGHPRRRQSQHRPSWMPCPWSRWSSARKRTWRW